MGKYAESIYNPNAPPHSEERLIEMRNQMLDKLKEKPLYSIENKKRAIKSVKQETYASKYFVVFDKFVPINKFVKNLNKRFIVKETPSIFHLNHKITVPTRGKYIGDEKEYFSSIENSASEFKILFKSITVDKVHLKKRLNRTLRAIDSDAIILMLEND
jgi:hypothetical protein